MTMTTLGDATYPAKIVVPDRMTWSVNSYIGRISMWLGRMCSKHWRSVVAAGILASFGDRNLDVDKIG